MNVPLGTPPNPRPTLPLDPLARCSLAHQVAERIQRWIAESDLQPGERLVAVGAEPVGSTPAEYARRIQSDVKRWADLIKRQGIKPD